MGILFPQIHDLLHQPSLILRSWLKRLRKRPVASSLPLILPLVLWRPPLISTLRDVIIFFIIIKILLQSPILQVLQMLQTRLELRILVLGIIDDLHDQSLNLIPVVTPHWRLVPCISCPMKLRQHLFIQRSQILQCSLDFFILCDLIRKDIVQVGLDFEIFGRKVSQCSLFPGAAWRLRFLEGVEIVFSLRSVVLSSSVSILGGVVLLVVLFLSVVEVIGLWSVLPMPGVP